MSMLMIAGPTLRRIAPRAVARLCKRATSEKSLAALHWELPLTDRQSSGLPSLAQVDGEGFSMSYETRNVLPACLRHGRAAVLASLVMLVAACSGDGDGSVGIGTGQDPDPVAPDFPIAYTKGPLFDEDEELQVNTDLRDILR